MTSTYPRQAQALPITPVRPAAVLWDMDGTLVDTEPAWIEAEFGLAEKYGGTWSEELALHLVGSDLLASGRFIREHMGIDRTPEQIVDELLDGVVDHIRREVPWCAGARELLADLRAAGIPTALVTMSYRRFAQPVVDALPPDSFDAVVTGDEVAHGKPHPEPYLRAAALLGVAPEDCLAIEDSTTGATSAGEAGCTVLVVPNHVAVEPGAGRLFVDSLETVRLLDDGIHAPVRPTPVG